MAQYDRAEIAGTLADWALKWGRSLATYALMMSPGDDDAEEKELSTKAAIERAISILESIL